MDDRDREPLYRPAPPPTRLPGAVGSQRQPELSMAEKRRLEYERSKQQEPPAPMRKPVSQQNLSTAKKLTSDNIWGFAIEFAEIAMDVIKALMVVGGVLAANLLDVIMGSISISLLLGSSLAGMPPPAIFGSTFSLGASAIQIFLWTAIRKRGIGVAELLVWKKLPKDMKLFIPAAAIVWLVDTVMDVAPISLMVQNSQYQGPIYYGMIVCVVILLVLLCGFSEILTANMKGILVDKANGK